MSVNQDNQSYKVFDLIDNGQLLWTAGDQLLFNYPGRAEDTSTAITICPSSGIENMLVRPNSGLEKILLTLEQVIVENKKLTENPSNCSQVSIHGHTDLSNAEKDRDKAIQELRDYKSKRGENLSEMLDAQAEANRLRLELEEAKKALLRKSTIELERTLLEIWLAAGVEEIYKYKNNIKAYRRDGLTRYDLINDLTYQLFPEVEDTANHHDAAAEDFKMRVDELLAARELIPSMKTQSL
ncbi:MULTISPECIES: hypothetical protein [Paenibacillus]|uniref:hypothetical protein n=1 Tax=Paenibacillus TaxID=44249 RepID=UPI000405AE85|nr:MULTISPECIES: hypothetical protein [Paenibacillus]OZQ62815.1 hypothetical protein CA599_25470 [Paenibacillus taichungensis]